MQDIAQQTSALYTWFGYATLYGAAVTGSIVMYLFASSKGFESTVPRLKQLLPGKSETFYYRADFSLVIFLGALVGVLFFQPTSSLQALAAGCSWVGALNILIKPKSEGEIFSKPGNTSA